MATPRSRIATAALNAATLARNSAGDDSIGASVGLTGQDLLNARQVLERMPQDSQPSAFDRRDLFGRQWLASVQCLTRNLREHIAV